MKATRPLFLGIFGTFAFSLGGIDCDPKLANRDTSILNLTRKARISIQCRNREWSRAACAFTPRTAATIVTVNRSAPQYSGADIERKWGDRRSAPRDYIFERPALLGKMRMGQDLANIGARAPKEEESPSPAGGASPAPQAAAASPGTVASAKAASPPPATSPSPRNSARNVTWCYCIETANQPWSGESSTFKVSCNSSGWGHKSSCGCITAFGRTTVARANGGITTNVFRCLASRASLFAAQYQS